MKSRALKLFLFIATLGFMVLLAVYVARGQPPIVAAREAAVWAVVSATVAVLARAYQARRHPECALCAVPAETGRKRS